MNLRIEELHKRWGGVIGARFPCCPVVMAALARDICATKTKHLYSAKDAAVMKAGEAGTRLRGGDSG